MNIQGSRLAVDYGDKRIGLAKSDDSRLIASPLLTLEYASNIDDVILRIIEIIDLYSILVLYIGLPLHLSGKESASSAKVEEFARRLKEALGSKIYIRLLDERLTTNSALRDLRSAGLKSDKKSIDQYAAVKILEFALEVEEKSGELAGHAAQ